MVVVGMIYERYGDFYNDSNFTINQLKLWVQNETYRGSAVYVNRFLSYCRTNGYEKTALDYCRGLPST
ncbi:unnamed protein product [Macrosiphum euphorbiae]|uniref:Uncharacterized protein n=1 Tax=Macrosiphum euphorbiae TaxID=13131 RepID=A0AAV0W8Z6_9HEMI|nr:unnamed protein product [Macrosiphum euphorbiae]